MDFSGNYGPDNTMRRLLAYRIPLNWETAAYVVILLLAIFTRFHNLGDRVMSHDESLHTRFSYNLYAEGDFQHTPLMHGPILFHMVALNYALFGDNDFTARIYTSLLGVLMVMSPLLFRYWLKRWGALLASIMLLISPLILYYNRYIREDTPAILAGIVMIWAILMYLSGPLEQRRKPYWLYVLAFGMIWNLGTKETAFMYIAIIGIFLAVYWFVRMAQHIVLTQGRPFHGKRTFGMLTLGILLGGVMALASYCILDIIQFDLVNVVNGVTFASLLPAQQATYYVWTALIIVVMLFVSIGTFLWAYRNGNTRLPLPQLAFVVGLMFASALALVIFEELSHTTNEAVSEGATPLRWTPLIATWVICILTCAFFIVFRRQPGDLPADPETGRRGTGLWGFLDLFPEFDVMVVIGTLILPWAAALIPYVMRGTTEDFTAIGNNWVPLAAVLRVLPNPAAGGQNIWTPDQLGQVLLGFVSWLPLMITSIVIGLAWNWRRWLVAAGVFYAIFVFFFTTMFTNLFGLATGMYYSLGYWLEQQGVRRGSQPQYYYAMLILPFYEFLAVIGGMLAMLAGLITFWRRYAAEQAAEQELAVQVALETRGGEDDEGATEKFTDEELGTPAEPIDSYDEQMERSAPLSEVTNVVDAGSADYQNVIFDDKPKRHPYSLPEFGSPELQEKAYRVRQMHFLGELPFLIFWSWLGVFNLILFTLAGEKMPWLGTHMAVPLIILTAWYLGRIVARIEPQRLLNRGWVISIVMAVFLITALQVFGTLIAGERPFGGLTASQLRATQNWLMSLAAMLGTGAALLVLGRAQWPFMRQMLTVIFFGFMGLITVRSAWMASFINYDEATEFLVYAHSGPAVKTVLNTIEEISYRTTDSLNLKFAYDNDVSWPYSWYFRHFPNQVYVGANPTMQNLADAVVVVVGDSNRHKVEPLLEDRYQKFQYVRMWWPMQDYFYMNADRLNNLFNLADPTASAIRHGMFDIWWNRDYKRYGEAVNKNFDLPTWPVQNAMHVYIRKDVAAQIWNYGVGDGTVENPLLTMETNQCNANFVDLQPLQVLNAPVPLARPLGMAFDAERNLYVAEESSHRISVFDPAGNYLRSFGSFGTGLDGLLLNRPNSLTIDDQGNIYVVDTWNFRVQKYAPGFEVPLARWGQSGTFGFDAPTQPTDAFWGPRDVKVDSLGRVLVADTGNKRIRVYEIVDNVAVWSFDIGRGGSGPGELDEPSSIAIHPVDGRVFISDTWNRRVSVFAPTGEFLNSFPVRGWYQQLGNEPYMAIDAERDLLYATDPDAGRVLVFTTSGECVGSFGQLAAENPGDNQFAIAGGVALDADGNVYVTDAGFGKIVKFPPFPAAEASETGPSGAGDVALETSPESTGDPTPEETAEATAAE
jgi:predicted membrane-bound mannosyltransferase/DNA-binding beta-propeller fold protein YncE